MEGAVFPDLEMDQVVTLLSGFAASAARASIDARRTAEQSGISDAEWWEINAPVLERVIPPDAYPISSRVGQVAGKEYNAVSDPARSFSFGLERILDGVEGLLKRCRALDSPE